MVSLGTQYRIELPTTTRNTKNVTIGPPGPNLLPPLSIAIDRRKLYCPLGRSNYVTFSMGDLTPKPTISKKHSFVFECIMYFSCFLFFRIDFTSVTTLYFFLVAVVVVVVFFLMGAFLAAAAAFALAAAAVALDLSAAALLAEVVTFLPLTGVGAGASNHPADTVVANVVNTSRRRMVAKERMID
jgi:hypothetical protein